MDEIERILLSHFSAVAPALSIKRLFEAQEAFARCRLGKTEMFKTLANYVVQDCRVKGRNFEKNSRLVFDDFWTAFSDKL